MGGIQNYSAAWQEPLCGASMVWVPLGQASQTCGWGSLALHTSCDPLGIKSGGPRRRRWPQLRALRPADRAAAALGLCSP